MNLFGLCQHCQLPIFVLETAAFCPYCQKPLPDDDKKFADDTLSNFLHDIKKANYFEYEDVQTLINAIETLIDINTKISLQLGISLVQLDKMKDRLEFYRRATTFRIK